MRKIGFTETALRDANQSQIATRLPFEKFAPILETMDKAGYYSVECWGGATFDSCLRFLNASSAASSSLSIQHALYSESGSQRH